MDGLYCEAMCMAQIYDIPKVVIDDYFEAFGNFVREEINRRIKTGIPARIDTDILMELIAMEANI